MATTLDQIARDRELLAYHGPDRVVPASEVLDKLREQPRKEPILSGLGNIDYVIGGGFFPGQLNVISGITGEGKTTFAKTLTRQFMLKANFPLWFSYEGDHEDFLRDFEGYDPLALRFMFMPLTLNHHDLPWVEARIQESYLKYNTRVVFIDHLHRLVDLGSKENVSIQVGRVVVKLTEMAIRNQMVIFLLCHTDKDQFKNGDEPGLGSVRDSSLIEQEATTVFYIWRFDDEGTTLVKIAKNRVGGTKNVRIPLRYEGGMYVEMSADEFDRRAADKAAREDADQGANRGGYGRSRGRGSYRRFA